MKLFVRLASFLLLLGTGCHRGFFSDSGFIRSEGGTLGHWERLPAGCTRSPFDGQPAARSSSVAALLWRSGGNPEWRAQQFDPTQADEPERLELSRTPKGLMASFDTVLMPGAVRLDPAVCRTLTLDSKEEPASFAEGRPSLGGRLQMDCTVKGSHLLADLRFSGCTF